MHETRRVGAPLASRSQFIHFLAKAASWTAFSTKCLEGERSMIQRHAPPFSSHQTPASSFASSAGSKPCTNRRSAHIDRKATTSPIGVHSHEISRRDLFISWRVKSVDLGFGNSRQGPSTSLTDKLIVGREEWCSLPGLGLPAIKTEIDSIVPISSLHALQHCSISQGQTPLDQP